MKRPIRILMVEDNEGDVILTEEALLDARFENKIISVKHGVAALEYLQKGKVQEGTLPDLILMDINLPLMNGHETISHIKKDEALAAIPIFIFSSSNAPSDMEKSGPHVQHYLTKPFDLDLFMQGIKKINQFYFSIVK